MNIVDYQCYEHDKYDFLSVCFAFKVIVISDQLNFIIMNNYYELIKLVLQVLIEHYHKLLSSPSFKKAVNIGNNIR